MNAIFDANIFIGARLSRDQYHSVASTIIREFIDGKIRFVFMTNYVLVEIINFLLKKGSSELASEVYEQLMNTSRLRILYVDKVMESEIRNLFLTYKTLTLTDCSLIVLAKELGISTIYSFDSGFDKVSGIKRLVEVQEFK